MRNLIVETRLNMTAGIMSVAKKKLYKVIVLVILISKDTRIDIKSRPHEWGQGKLAGHMKSKEKKGEIMVFLNEFIVICCFFYMNVCVN
jgi:hypothetical protein